MPFYTYVLKCENGALYTGWTNDLQGRYDQHVSGKGAKYTRAYKPVEMLASFEFDSKSAAMQWEWQFKKLSRQKKLELLKQS